MFRITAVAIRFWVIIIIKLYGHVRIRAKYEGQTSGGKCLTFVQQYLSASTIGVHEAVRMCSVSRVTQCS